MTRFFQILVLFAGMTFGLSAASFTSDPYDLFHDDDTTATLNHARINFPQTHVISGPDDEDWIVFYAEQGLPYTIKVQEVGAGLDPELWVYVDGLDLPGVKTDFGAMGADESFSRLNWPASGWFYARVKAAEFAEGPTSYTLTAAGDWGANLGLATISGMEVKRVQAGGDTLSLPADVPTAAGRPQRQERTETPLPSPAAAKQSETTTRPLYTKTSLTYPAGAFSPGPESFLLLSGLGDPIHRLDYDWIARWHARFPRNFTITRVGLFPFAPPDKPMELAIEMRSEAVTADLSDGETTWPDTTFQDVAPGDAKESVRVFRWNAADGSWDLFDASPDVVETAGGWLAVTHVSDFAPPLASSNFFAAAVSEIPPSKTGVLDWLFYP